MTDKKLKLTWIGHSCFVIDDGFVRVMFDPYQPGSVPGLKDVPTIGVNKVFISHDHADHNYDRIPCFLNLVDIKYEQFEVAHDDHGGSLRGMNLVTIVYLGGFKIVHMGDIGCALNKSQSEKLKGADVILCPINGFYTIGYDEAIDLFNLVKPKIMIPMHYFYNNTGYPDDNEIDKLIKFGENVCLTPLKEINVEGFIKDKPYILVLDHKGE